MEKSNKKSHIKHPLLCIICAGLMLIFIYIAFTGTGIVKSVTKKPVNLNELKPDNVESGQIADGVIYASVGTYGQTYKTDSDGSIIEDANMNYYYLVAVDDTYCITLYTDDPDMVNELQILTDATDKFSANETETIEADNFRYTGMIYPLTDDEMTHLYSWVLDNGVFGAESVEDASQYIIPYKLMEYNKYEGIPYLVIGCVGFVASAVGMLIFLKQREETEED